MSCNVHYMCVHECCLYLHIFKAMVADHLKHELAGLHRHSDRASVVPNPQSWTHELVDTTVSGKRTKRNVQFPCSGLGPWLSA